MSDTKNAFEGQIERLAAENELAEFGLITSASSVEIYLSSGSVIKGNVSSVDDAIIRLTMAGSVLHKGITLVDLNAVVALTVLWTQQNDIYDAANLDSRLKLCGHLFEVKRGLKIKFDFRVPPGEKTIQYELAIRAVNTVATAFHKITLDLLGRDAVKKSIDEVHISVGDEVRCYRTGRTLVCMDARSLKGDRSTDWMRWRDLIAKEL